MPLRTASTSAEVGTRRVPSPKWLRINEALPQPEFLPVPDFLLSKRPCYVLTVKGEGSAALITVVNVCTAGTTGAPCNTGSDCDSTPGSGDGQCTEGTWNQVADCLVCQTTTAMTARLFVNGPLTDLVGAQIIVSVPNFSTVLRSCLGTPETVAEAIAPLLEIGLRLLALLRDRQIRGKLSGADALSS